MNRRRLAAIALALVAIGIAVGLWHRQGQQATASTSSGTGGSGVATVAATTGSATGKTGDHVTQIGREEREKLAQRIAAANKARAAAHGGAPARPTLPDQGSDDPLSRVQDHVLQALKEAIPFLAQCYEQSIPFDARTGITTMAMMTLTTDPDIGTVIDADQIFDDKNQPIPKALDECLRNTMQTLALPPLDSDDQIKIQYSFRFE